MSDATHPVTSVPLTDDKINCIHTGMYKILHPLQNCYTKNLERGKWAKNTRFKMLSSTMLPSSYGTWHKDLIKMHAHPIFHALIGMFSYLTDNYQGHYNNA